MAREKLERSLKQNPKDPDVHTGLGLLYDRVGETKKADQHYREALRLAPDNPDISNNYAIYLCKRGRIDDGVERFAAVAVNRYYRTPEVALTNAGVCLRDAKRPDEAEQSFLAAIRARPDYSEATVQLATLHMERGQLAEARKVVDTYLGAFRPQADVLFAAVTVARAAKDKMSEEKYSRRLRLEFPDSAQARALQARQLSAMDETAAPAPVAPPPAPRSIGERLRAGRERAGLSIAASAEKLHLDIKVIEALEADRFADLGASVYVRGHLRRYADFVGEAGAELVANYTTLTARPLPPDLTQAPHPERRTDPRRLVTPLVGLVCAAVLLLAIWWVLSGSNSGAGQTSAVPTSQVQTNEKPPAASALPAGSSRHPLPAMRRRTRLPAAPAAAATNSAPAGAVAANAPPKREDSVPVRETRLKLELDNDSWVEVYDCARRAAVLRRGQRRQRAERERPRSAARGARQCRRRHRRSGRAGAARFPTSAVDGEGARFVVNRSGSLARAR